MVKFNKLDFGSWSDFRAVKKQTLSAQEFELVCQLHAKYYNHKYEKPCTCNPRKIKLWITQLNIIWDNGIKEN
jgi:hypothetical protein|tara:strand:- start:197 stop:415 length:219 start_codon:yes stop_codon:yes gene_type:complete